MTDLNLQGVQNNIDAWIRQKINKSALVNEFCSS
jgi:hypothetical protein